MLNFVKTRLTRAKFF